MTDELSAPAPSDRPASRALARRLRWGVPVVAVVTVAAAVAVPAALAAGDPKGLAPRTAAALLTQLAGAQPTALSGTVVQTARLGLPSLPPGTAGTDPTALVSGSHTLRVWSDGTDRARLALLGQLAEYDLVRSGRDVWTYRSEKNEAAHYTLPAEQAADGPQGAPPQGMQLPATPQQAADQVLAALTPTTAVRVGDQVRVAGREAYTLVLSPQDTSSLVGDVRVAVDSRTSVPLRVQVFAAADREVPALEVGFTDVSFARPAASVFTFSAPKGARVTEHPAAPDAGGAAGREAGPGEAPEAAPGDATPGQPQVRGTGWTSVVIASGVDVAALQGADPRLLDALTQRVPEGRLLTTRLLSVLLTDDGRVLAGAVRPDVLRAMA